MDAITPRHDIPQEPVKERRFLPALADAIGVWFPELGGRSLAVSEVSITKENVPTLPLVMVAFVRSLGPIPTRSHRSAYEMIDEFVVEFWLEPARYKKANGSETPFWSYYDYEAIRDTLLENLELWEGPGCERVAYRGLTIGADPLAVTLTFSFSTAINWKAKVREYGQQFDIKMNILGAQSECCEPDCSPPDPCD